MKAQPITVVAIDDAEEVLVYLTLIFKKVGYRVLTAENGAAGLRLIEQEQPDIILCDIMMPPPNGFELRKILSRNPATATIPFIFLSARSARADKISGIEMGADDYITKPFDKEELLARVNAVLRRTTRSYQQGLIEAQTEIEQIRSTILSKTNEELRNPLDKVLAALTLTLTERFAHDPRQQKRFIKIALDSAYSLHTLVEKMASSGELNQEQVDAFLDQVVDLENDFYKWVE